MKILETIKGVFGKIKEWAKLNSYIVNSLIIIILLVCFIIFVVWLGAVNFKQKEDLAKSFGTNVKVMDAYLDMTDTDTDSLTKFPNKEVFTSWVKANQKWEKEVKDSLSK